VFAPFFLKALCASLVVLAVCRTRDLDPRESLFPCSEKESNLVDSASSHTLVSKIKPCMSKYKQLYTVKLRMAHYISYSLFDSTLLLG
jgi:hypothetical protein